MDTSGKMSRVRVVVDAMGGDFAPTETVLGSLEALKVADIEVLLVGDKKAVEEELSKYDYDNSLVTVVPSVDKIGDDEHPLHAMRSKPDASIIVATKLLKSGAADVLVSMGSTGASMASSVMILGLMDGLERPCIGGPFLGMAPKTMLVDMGSNVDCRPSLMLSFAALGTAFSRTFIGLENPRVGLLSVGAEEAKGNRQVQECYKLFEDSHMNFVGNVEGMDFFTGKADVIVCDGFVGNILMKFTEGLGAALGSYLQKGLSSQLENSQSESIISDLWRITNLPRKMGGPLFGVNAPVVLGHGSSKADGVSGAINTAVRCFDLHLVDSMRDELAEVTALMAESG